MGRTLGLALASSVLVAGGCALVQHANVSVDPRAAAGLSGPGTLTITNLPVAHRGTQVLGNGAVVVVARCYAASPTYGDFWAALPSWDAIELGNPQVEHNASNASLVLLATGSVSAGSATMILPSLPAGKHIIRVDAFDIPWGAMGFPISAAGTESMPNNHLVAQSESSVSTMVGMPYTASFPIYNVVPYRQNPNVSVAVGATASVTVSAVTPGPSGFFLRLANWNPYLCTPSGSVRVIIHPPVPFAATLATSSSVASWFTGDMRSAKGYQATQSFALPWRWSTDRSYMFNDIDFTAVSRADYTSHVTSSSLTYSNGDATFGSLSLRFPAAFFPAGTWLQITDIASGSSQPLPTTIPL